MAQSDENRYLIVYLNKELCDGDGMLCRFDTHAISAQKAVDTLRFIYNTVEIEVREVYLLTDMKGEWK